MAEPPVPPVPVQPVPPVPVQPVPPTVDDLLGFYIAARTRADFDQLNTTLARLADSVKDLATKDDLKELATKASVEATVKNSVKEAVKDLATKASVEAIVKEVKNLATKDGVDDLALNIQDLTEAFDKMAYNVRAKAINKTRLRLAGTHPGGGIIPLVPLLDKEGIFVPVRWASEVTDASQVALATWAARFGLEPVETAGEVEGGGKVGHEVGRAEIQALTPIQRATMQRELVSR